MTNVKVKELELETPQIKIHPEPNSENSAMSLGKKKWRKITNIMRSVSVMRTEQVINVANSVNFFIFFYFYDLSPY